MVYVERRAVQRNSVWKTHVRSRRHSCCTATTCPQTIQFLLPSKWEDALVFTLIGCAGSWISQDLSNIVLRSLLCCASSKTRYHSDSFSPTNPIFLPMAPKNMTRRQNLACWGLPVGIPSQHASVHVFECKYTMFHLPFPKKEAELYVHAFNSLSILGFLPPKFIYRYNKRIKYPYPGKRSLLYCHVAPIQSSPRYVLDLKWEAVSHFALYTDDSTHCD